MPLSPYRQSVDAFLERALKGPPRRGGLCLDVGGGTVRGRWRADTAIDAWTVIDVRPGPEVDYCVSLKDAPSCLRPRCFDLVKATDVLYLMPEDELVSSLAAATRLLRPGGALVATLPFVRPASEIEDQARWTPWALRQMLGIAGFMGWTVIELGGWWSILLQLFYDQAYHRHPYRRQLYSRLAPRAREWDRRHPTAWALGYGVVATT